MKVLFLVLVSITNLIAVNALADVTIVQGGISYSCSPVDPGNGHGGGHCKTSCATYCSQYDDYPFATRCLSKETECGSNVKVVTHCAQYDSYPFQDRCLKQEDFVTKDPHCD